MAWANAEILDRDMAEGQLSDHGGIVYRPLSGGGGSGGRDLLCPLPGTGQSLVARFIGMRNRFRSGGNNRRPVCVFVQPSKSLFESVTYEAPPHRLVFSLREGNTRAGFAPRQLNEAVVLVTEVRDRAAKRLCETSPALTDDVERFLVGRSATDADKASRVRIVPVPSVGHSHADMMVRRIAVYVPQPCPLRVGDLSWAFAQVAWTNSDRVVVSELQRANDDDMAERYESTARCWRSVTPLALGPARLRRLDPARTRKESKGGSERASEEALACGAVVQALRHVGVRVCPVDVRVQREPFHSRGARAEAFAASTRFPKDSLWHVEVTFAEPMTGPLVLGNGRYLGLGLMQPNEPMPGVLVFGIGQGLADAAEPSLVAHAARRAMMARVQARLPRGRKLPAYVSGHEEDGRPADSGQHRHLAVVADLERRRILYIAPNHMQRGGVCWRNISAVHRQTEQALQGMDILRAGKAGRLSVSSATLDADTDALFAPSRIWLSITDYSVTRHRRRLSDEEALRADVLGELRRIGWPTPRSVTVLAVRRGSPVDYPAGSELLLQPRRPGLYYWGAAHTRVVACLPVPTDALCPMKYRLCQKTCGVKATWGSSMAKTSFPAVVFIGYSGGCLHIALEHFDLGNVPSDIQESIGF